MTPAAVLELRELVRDFPGQRAVDHVSLRLERGKFYSLLGPSGCGKTTTLRLIGGFDRPDSGDVLLNGKTVNHLQPWQRDVSTVFQNYALFPHLTALGNVAFGLQERRAADARKQALRALDLVKLAEKRDRYPSQLSGGEKQRVALARSIVLKPDLLLLDEPLAALDPQLRLQMRGELKAMQRTTGITFLLVTHDQEEALSLSDRIAVMNSGRVEQFGTPEEIYLRPATPFVAGFMGAMNWFGGVGVRPERTLVSREAVSGEMPAEATSRRALAEETVFLGNCVHLHARMEDGSPAISQLPRDHAKFTPGEPVWLHWQQADEIRFE